MAKKKRFNTKKGTKTSKKASESSSTQESAQGKEVKTTASGPERTLGSSAEKSRSSDTHSNTASQSSTAAQSNTSGQSKWMTIANKVWPHAAAILFFYALVTIYFYPSVVEDKVVRQPDIEQAAGMGRDIWQATQEYPDDVIAWTGALYGGMPNYNIGVHGLPQKYTGHLYSWILQIDAMAAGIVLMGLLSFYLLLISMGAPPILSAAGAVAFAFSSYNFIILEAGHVNKGYVMAVMPLTVAGMLLTFQKRWLRGFLLFLLGVTFSLDMGHPQITYYLALFCAILYIGYVIFTVQAKDTPSLAKTTSLFALGSILAMVPNIGKLYTDYEMAQSSLRGPSELTITPSGETLEEPNDGLDIDYAFMWSYGKMEMLTALIPYAYGGKTGGTLGQDSNLYKELRRRGAEVGSKVQTYTYWGDKPATSGPNYFGAVVCFLMVFGLIHWKNQLKWFVLGGSVFLTLLAFGKNLAWFNTIMFDILPFYNKFRTVEMALVIPAMGAVILGFMGLKEFYDSLQQPQLTGAKVDAQQSKQINKALLVSFGIVGGLALAVAAVPTLFLSFQSPLDAQYNLPTWYFNALIEDRKALAVADAIRSFLFVGLTFAVLFAMNRYADKKHILLGGLFGVLALVTIDLWTVNQRFLNDEIYTDVRPGQNYEPKLADERIFEDTDLGYRVLNLNGTFSDNHTPFFHRAVGGYHPVKLRKTQDLLDFYINREIQYVIKQLQGVQSTENLGAIFQDTPVLNMFNTKYIVYNLDQPPIQNPYAYGAAWFVEAIQEVESPDQEITQLANVDLQNTAIWRAGQSTSAESNPTYNTEDNTIELTNYAPHRLTYEVNAQRPGYIVFSEVFYKDWDVTMTDPNGVTEILPLERVNWIMRGLGVSEGEYTLSFVFSPDEVVSAWKVSSASSLGIVALTLGLLLTLFLRWLRSEKVLP